MSFSHDDFMQAQTRIADLEADNARLEGIQLQAQELILRAEDWRDERDRLKRELRKARVELKGKQMELDHD